jgi:ParB-like chromosome segregation protein Spo0J
LQKPDEAVDRRRVLDNLITAESNGIDEEDGIIAGHCRVLAAHLLGLHEVPCIVLSHLTPTQRRAYVLADNKLALNAGWDLEMLSLEIGELGEAGFDLNLTGFDEFELGELFAERTQGRTDPDDAPEPPAHPVAEPGDLWVLGRHRSLCGDSTVATDVERVLGGLPGFTGTVFEDYTKNFTIMGSYAT